MMTLRLAAGLAALTLALSGCGYTLQTSKSPLVEREKITTVYVAPASNGTLRVGVENMVYNALVRSLSAHKTLRMVSREEDAETVLNSSIKNIVVTTNATTPGENIPGDDRFKPYFKDIPFTTYYSASLDCSFSLVKRIARPEFTVNPKTGIRKIRNPGKSKLLWSSSFSRGKSYPAFLRTGAEGTTSPLITDSELDRVLGEIVTSMMDDVHESMLNSF